MQAPDWLQASGEGSRRQASGGRVRASRRPRATPPKPPEMYRRPPTAATAWATDSSIGGPTEAGPGETQDVETLREEPHKGSSQRDAEQSNRLRRAETDMARQTRHVRPGRAGESDTDSETKENERPTEKGNGKNECKENGDKGFGTRWRWWWHNTAKVPGATALFILRWLIFLCKCRLKFFVFGFFFLFITERD